MKKQKNSIQGYLELFYPEDGVCAAYWISGSHFFRQYDYEDRPKRVSGAEYHSAYEQVHDL